MWILDSLRSTGVNYGRRSKMKKTELKKPMLPKCGLKDVRYDTTAQEYYCSVCATRLGANFRDRIYTQHGDLLGKQLDSLRKKEQNEKEGSDNVKI